MGNKPGASAWKLHVQLSTPVGIFALWNLHHTPSSGFTEFCLFIQSLCVSPPSASGRAAWSHDQTLLSDWLGVRGGWITLFQFSRSELLSSCDSSDKTCKMERILWLNTDRAVLAFNYRDAKLCMFWASVSMSKVKTDAEGHRVLFQLVQGLQSEIWDMRYE